jgi:hypothetical protein
MSLAELKEAVTALSVEERHQLRDVLDALEEGVSVEQLHEIDQMLKETLSNSELLIPADKFWDEFIKSAPLPKGDAS